MNKSYAILIVAAGASSRLGQAKQLLPYKDSTLLDHTIAVALGAQTAPVHIVLGANADLISRSFAKAKYHYHRDWAKGMGSSIGFGVQQLNNEEASGVLVLQCDQPYLSVPFLCQIDDVIRHSDQEILISEYQNGQQGPPVYFANNYFDELTQLTGAEGAKPIVRKYKDRVGMISFPKGEFDVDYPEDIKILK